MKEVFHLVGETAAQSVWNLSAGGALTPLLSTVDKNGHANYMRLAMDNSDDAVRYGHDKLDRQEEGKVGAVFVADGYVTLDSGTTDALVVEVRVYQDSVVKCQIVIPYRPATSAKGFVIHRPQVTALENIEEAKIQPLLDAFFVGIEAHDKGSKVWNECYRDDDTEDQELPIIFDSQSWHLMQEIPFLAFYLVAGRNRKPTGSDRQTFEQVLARGTKYQSTLMSRLLPYCVQNYPSLIERYESGDISYTEQLGQAMAAVSNYYSSFEVKGFKLALVAMAQDFVLAKNQLNGTANLSNDDAKMALATLIVSLDIELDS